MLRLSRRILKLQKGLSYTCPLPPPVQSLPQQPAQHLVLCAQSIMQSVVPQAVRRPCIRSVAQEQLSHLGATFLTGQDQSRSVGWDKSGRRLSPGNPEVLLPEIPLMESDLTSCGKENHGPTPANDKALDQTRASQMPCLGAAASESRGAMRRALFSSFIY